MGVFMFCVHFFVLCGSI